MTQEEQDLMKRFEITVTEKQVYTYKGFKYDRLNDAVNYAMIEEARQNTTGASNSSPKAPSA